MNQRKPMLYVVWGLVVLLIILHQDNWFWTDSTLVLGFLPVTLLYHMCISLAAAVTWLLAVRFAWPTELNTADTPTEKGQGS
jgi:hypothetical protein